MYPNSSTNNYNTSHLQFQMQPEARISNNQHQTAAVNQNHNGIYVPINDGTCCKEHATTRLCELVTELLKHQKEFKIQAKQLLKVIDPPANKNITTSNQTLPFQFQQQQFQSQPLPQLQQQQQIPQPQMQLKLKMRGVVIIC